MNLRRWTPLTYLFPKRYVDRDKRWEELDFLEWSSAEYQWTQDTWNGFRDFAKPPVETLESGRGDCEDYALVAVSWAITNNRTEVGLAFCWDPPTPWPTHVIAFDDERVYSSGSVLEKTVDAYLDDSKYSFALKRQIDA